MKRKISLLATASLIAVALISVPTARAAEPACQTAGYITQCVGATSDTAPYTFIVPANFNGTVFVYSHGYRPNIDVPAGIPGYGGYKVNNTPQPGPLVGGKDTVIKALLAQGYAVAGSGFARQGWNADSGMATDVELINTFKTKFTTTKKVIAWGESLGGFITQALAENHPDLISAAAPMCMAAGTVEAELTMAGDFLWGLKTFFDPSIKGGSYSAGAAGYAEAMGDLVKVFTVIGKLQTAISTNVWPDTSGKAGAALGSIPPRSALLLLGLMSGISTQSAHFDATSGPGSPNTAAYTNFALAASPALAILENGASAAALAVLATLDVEQQAGGAIFDNTKTDYSSRVASESIIFNAALSGESAIKGMLGYLAVAPRVTGNPDAMAKMRSLLSHTGKINVPTVTMTGVADPVTPAGNSQWLADKYAAQYEQARADALAAVSAGTGYVPARKQLVSIWSTTPAKYTTFTAEGLPDTSVAAAPGTNHCNFTAKQYLAVASLLTGDAVNGEPFPPARVKSAVRKAGNLSVDPDFRAPLLKFYGNE